MGDLTVRIDSEARIHSTIVAASGPDTKSLIFVTTADVQASFIEDLQKIRSHRLLGRIRAGASCTDSRPEGSNRVMTPIKRTARVIESRYWQGGKFLAVSEW